MITDPNELKRFEEFLKISFRTIAPLSFAVLFASHLYSQQNRYYYYQPSTYGSDGLFNPISLLANGGFDSYQIIDDRQPILNVTYWNRGATNIWRSATSPLPVISKFGWSRFLRQEVFPTSLDIDDAQYAPNYALHLIGGGMEYRKISEWYDYQGFPVPFFFGAATRIAYEFLNEAAENGPAFYPNEDCLPDMLIFQPLGILLFSFDDVSEFFSSTLSLNDWSQPVVLTFAPLAVRNAGQNFVMKLGLNRERSTSLFFHFGDFALLGLSFKTNGVEAVSVGAGLASTGTKELPIQNGVPSNTVITRAMAGVYYDRNNSLLASAVYSDNQNNRLRLNIYPGLLSYSSFSPGFFVTLGNHGEMIAGITAHVLPIGLGVYAPR